MGKPNLPQGWSYTGRTLLNCLNDAGVCGRFYYDAGSKAIYTVRKIFRIGSIKDSRGPLLEVDVKYVDSDNPKRAKAIGVHGGLAKFEKMSLPLLVRDNEVIKDS